MMGLRLDRCGVALRHLGTFGSPKWFSCDNPGEEVSVSRYHVILVADGRRRPQSLR